MPGREGAAGRQVALTQAPDEGFQLARLLVQESQRLGLVGIRVRGGMDPVHLIVGRGRVLAPDPGLAAKAIVSVPRAHVVHDRAHGATLVLAALDLGMVDPRGAPLLGGGALHEVVELAMGGDEAVGELIRAGHAQQDKPHPG